MSGIYCIRNLVDGKRYVGYAKNLQRRKSDHFRDLRKNHHKNSYLQNAYNKYGQENFVFEIIQELENDQEILKLMEIYWICFYDSFKLDGQGYNLTRGGDGNVCCVVSEEKKKYMSEHYSGENAYWYGKKRDPDTVEKMKAGLTGRKQSEDEKNMRSKSFAGKKKTYASNRFVGVSPHKLGGWNVRLTVNRKHISIGYFHDEVEAALAYNEAAKEYFGDDAVLNEITQEDIDSIVPNPRISKYKYLSYDPDRKKWTATVTENGYHYRSGRFDYEVEAAMAANEMLLEIFGPKAKHKLNKISEEEIENLWNLP